MARRPAARLLVVVLGVAGVVGMHTLGHPTDGAHGGPIARASHAVVGHLQMSDPAVADVVSMILPRGGMRLNPLEVCLAILAAGLLLLIAGMVLVWARRAIPHDTRRRALALAGRGPPPCVWVGLRLVDLTVVRR
jgi:hypothetical protein